jgi:hypothetical protein
MTFRFLLTEFQGEIDHRADPLSVVLIEQRSQLDEGLLREGLLNRLHLINAKAPAMRADA